MDWFMLNDKPSLFQKDTNTLEKITHQYHMQEIYQKAAIIYKDLLENPPKDVNGICSCATDLTWNGVMKEVVAIARHLRHFGKASRAGRAFNGWYKTYGGGRGKRSADEDKENRDKLFQSYLENSNIETSHQIVNSSSKWRPGTLVGPDFGLEKWVPYSAMLTFSLPDDDGIRDFAYFIYCMLNHQKQNMID